MKECWTTTSFPTFGDLPLRDLNPMTLQSYFSKMASSSLAQESKDKIRDVLSSVLGSAQRYGQLVANPTCNSHQTGAVGDARSHI